MTVLPERWRPAVAYAASRAAACAVNLQREGGVVAFGAVASLPAGRRDGALPAGEDAGAPVPLRRYRSAP